jgi:hypothetical protein
VNEDGRTTKGIQHTIPDRRVALYQRSCNADATAPQADQMTIKRANEH